MAAGDVRVYECPNCGRLWVGVVGQHAGSGYDGGGFTEDEYMVIEGQVSHAEPRQFWKAKSPSTWVAAGCYGRPLPVHRPAIEAAYRLSGREAAEAMVDFQLRDAVLDYERMGREAAKKAR